MDAKVGRPSPLRARIRVPRSGTPKVLKDPLRDCAPVRGVRLEHGSRIIVGDEGLRIA